MKVRAALLVVVLTLLAWSSASSAERPSRRSPVAACQGCHGVQPGAPRLEGLSRSYMTRQIQGFLKGERGAGPGGEICSLEALEALKPADYVSLVGHYTEQSPEPDDRGAVSAELLARGEALYREGALELSVQPCAACHGRDATGGKQTGLESSVVAPRLAGQDRAYLESQLMAFKHGARANDYYGVMQRMVLELSEPDFEAVAAWLSTLDPATVPSAPPPTAAPAMPEKAALCQVCHGIGGESMAETFPKIGGLSRDHIVKQLQDIRDGRRVVDVMTPVVYALTDAEMEAIGEYFSRFGMARGPYDAFKARRGEDLFLNGNLVTGYPACMVCHGVDGKGLSGIEWSPGDIPRLAGQHPGYIQKALRDFREGSRGNDHGAMMRNIAARMTDQEIEDVSHYLFSMGDP